ncbi:hypothetical protein GOBAR_AA07911 [Gossypium barbadense]|uniref:Uncharacterized protein n=1 Tax=Gossypium barbadense TaxID=3634 RepID=A0A2P5YAT4_GOSBA|nr:hypothetical protein GOBAR_AA07911 [Gossypium barbadense]
MGQSLQEPNISIPEPQDGVWRPEHFTSLCLFKHMTALLVVVLIGASMVIGDGVLTPAISGSLLNAQGNRMGTVPEPKGIKRTTAVEAEKLKLISEGCNPKADHVEGYIELFAKPKIYFATALALWGTDFYVKVEDDVHVNIGCMKSGPVLSQKRVRCNEPEYWQFGQWNDTQKNADMAYRRLWEKCR